MIPSWILLAIAAGFASNLFNFLNRFVLTKESDSTAFGWLNELVRFFIVLLILPFDNQFMFTQTTALAFLSLGAVEVVSVYIFMKMHAYAHLSISTIISRTRLIWIPILAFLLLGEKLTLTEYVGIAVLFSGLSIAVSPHKIFMDKGITMAYASAICVAVLNIVMKAASPLMSTSLVLLGMSYLSIIFFPAVMKSSKQRLSGTLKKNLVLKVLSGISNTGSMYLYVYALKLGDVSKVTAIYQGMMVVSIIAGIVILGETQDAAKKIAGALVTLGGVLLLTVF